ncbi:UDP-galactose transporter senju-like [Ornithodoros turicata]|uniref:UDP-galactose transporter senju-like n=1 Tax=Ornithodoros turicata TaxID=34597 RepID=UPI003138F21D
MNMDEKHFLGDLFPTKLSALVFVAYIGFFVNQGILVTATKDSNNSYNYSITTVVLFTECLKLVVSTLIYLRDHSFKQQLDEILKHRKVLGLYFVPALLYCFYNNLAFINLATFDPTTYNLLLQFRVVITGILFQAIFKKTLSKKQWLSLILLTSGCIVKELSVPTRHLSSADGSFWGSIFSASMLFLLIQMFCSCLAGVYNEFLLKDTGVDIHIMIHNVFMYLDSIVCNVAVLGFRGELVTAFSIQSLSTLLQGKVVAVMVNGAICGIVTSVFLKSLNSILKTFASALDLSFTAVLCWIIFQIPIDVYTVAAIAIVSFATYLYSQQPVVNKPKDTRPHHDSDGEQDASLLNHCGRRDVV